MIPLNPGFASAPTASAPGTRPHPKRIRSRTLAAGVFLLILILAGLSRLRLDVEVLNLLPAHAPAVHGLKLYQQNFSNAGELLITLRGSSAERVENAARSIAEELRADTNLVSAVTWQPPWLEHPGQAAELAAYLWLNQPPEVFGALTNRLLGAPARDQLAATRERLATSLSPEDLARLSHDPFDLLRVPPAADLPSVFDHNQELFASTDGTFRLVFVRAVDALRNYRACQEWLQAIQQKLAEVRARDGIASDVAVRFTGRPAFVAEIAGGMEQDINKSLGGTLVIIALLFLWIHRTWRPLVWLVTLLGLLLAGTLAVGALLLGTLNVVSVGFAAILLGLAADYALVLYQEHRAAPADSPGQIRSRVGPSIVWSALTTAGAFLILNLGGLPGLSQLGTLVGIGIALAAVVMLYGFLPPLVRHEALRSKGAAPVLAPLQALGIVFPAPVAWTLTLGIGLAAGALLWWRPPALDHSPDPLRPRHSPAYSTLEEVRAQMKSEQDPLWLVIAGMDEAQVADRLKQILPALQRAQASGAISQFALPVGLWPDPGFQNANRLTLLQVLPGRDDLRKAALESGFTATALAATETLFDTWDRAAGSTRVFWPSNAVSQWVLANCAARTDEQLLALGLIYPASKPGAPDAWTRELPAEGVWLAGWELLGRAVLEVVQRDLWRVLVPMSGLLLLSLWLAFRRPLEMLLSLATLALSALSLLGVMSMAGWSWNLLNLTAFPLLLGTGVDYSIHIQSALRRHGGDIVRVRQIIGRALMLCAGTTVAAFGSLAWSSNAGLASLGAVCATGIALTFFISVYLLPTWWHSLAQPGLASAGAQPYNPSALYRTDVWQLGQSAARLLPAGLAARLGRVLARIYWLTNRRRREVVIRNLLPAVGGDRTKARALSRDLFSHFAGKLIDLWRYECGLPIDDLLAEVKGWEHFEAAQKRGRGVLLVTVHLGNWELGAPTMAGRGTKLTVVTLNEPHAGLTELRRASRSRWGIETLVVGENPFAFVEVIRLLDSGGTVALLVDRPPATSATLVELFGRPFAASIAAAELARASGCALLPVCVPRATAGYCAEMLPEIHYARAALGSRPAREKLTQEMMRRFEPVIQQHLSQWYHFVPVWPRQEPPLGEDQDHRQH